MYIYVYVYEYVYMCKCLHMCTYMYLYTSELAVLGTELHAFPFHIKARVIHIIRNTEHVTQDMVRSR